MAVKRGPLLRAFWRMHKWILLTSGGRRLPVTWRQAAGEEAEQLYARFVQADPS